jgi:uncharacterized protein YndB with AHSA1/START domain
MTVTSVDKDYDALSLTLIADFPAPSDAVWELWADPRQLERWWGPPTYPATMEQHDFTTGGTVTYYMTGPDGERFHGFWELTEVRPKTGLDLVDRFADADGEPDASMPVTTTTMRLSDTGGGTRMELSSSFESRADMDRMVEMGMDEGLTQAVGQMDGLLASTSVR